MYSHEKIFMALLDMLKALEEVRVNQMSKTTKPAAVHNAEVATNYQNGENKSPSPFAANPKYFQGAAKLYDKDVSCACGGPLFKSELSIVQYDKPEKVFVFCGRCAQVSLLREAK